MNIKSGKSERVLFIGYEGVQAMDVVGPMEVFSTANLFKPESIPPY
ncbi:MAG: hypothetical protein ACODTL_08665 [Brucella sp.]